jgi:hypothetical protein
VRQRKFKCKREVVSKISTDENKNDGHGIMNNKSDGAGLSPDTPSIHARLALEPEDGNSVIRYRPGDTSQASAIQLYYGPSSNFSLMQLMYRQLVEGCGDVHFSLREDGAEEAGPNLNVHSHRRLYLGFSARNRDIPHLDQDKSPSITFVHPSTASKYLERFLSTIYHMMPWHSKDEYRRRLERLYDKQNLVSLESPDATIMLLILAMGAAMMEDNDQGEVLFQRAKVNTAKFDDLVNLQTIQIHFIMISHPTLWILP